MTALLMSFLFAKHNAHVPVVRIGEALEREAEARAPSYGGRFYYIVTLPEGRSFANLHETFKDVGFVPRPRVRIGDAFIGSGYRADEATNTARILAEPKFVDALRDLGYKIAKDIPAIKPAEFKR